MSREPETQYHTSNIKSNVTNKYSNGFGKNLAASREIVPVSRQLRCLQCDDSGSDPNQSIGLATAVRIPSKQISSLENEWERFMAKEGLSWFHTSECIAKNEKHYRGWDDEKVRKVFARVRQITRKYGVGAASFAVNKKDYDEVVPEHFRKHIGKFHYTWAMRHVITFTDRWRLEEAFQYVFDWMGRANDPGKLEIEDVMAQAEEIAVERGQPGLYHNYVFRNMRETPALQCVDAVGWTCYQYAKLIFRKVPLTDFAQQALEAFPADREDNGWLYAFTITRPKLEKWVSAELADGRSLERFKQFERKKAAKAR